MLKTLKKRNSVFLKCNNKIQILITMEFPQQENIETGRLPMKLVYPGKAEDLFVLAEECLACFSSRTSWTKFQPIRFRSVLVRERSNLRQREQKRFIRCVTEQIHTSRRRMEDKVYVGKWENKCVRMKEERKRL